MSFDCARLPHVELRNRTDCLQGHIEFEHNEPRGIPGGVAVISALGFITYTKREWRRRWPKRFRRPSTQRPSSGRRQRKAEEAARAAASTAVRTAVGNAAPCMKMRDEAPFRAHGAPIGTPIRAPLGRLIGPAQSQRRRESFDQMVGTDSFSQDQVREAMAKCAGDADLAEQGHSTRCIGARAGPQRAEELQGRHSRGVAR